MGWEQSLAGVDNEMIGYHEHVGLLVPLLVVPVCVVVVLRRWRIGRWLAAPAALAAYVIVDATWFAVAILPVMEGDPSMKAVMLAKGISEVMNCTAFALIVHVPLLIAAWLVGRWLSGRTPPVDRS